MSDTVLVEQPVQHFGARTEQHQAYFLFGLATGLDFFGRGFTRTFIGSHLSGFAHGMVKTMASAPLPAWLTLATGYVVPCSSSRTIM